MGMPSQLRTINEQRRMQLLDRAVIVSELYCSGLNQKQIAEKLGVSRGTVLKSIDLARDLWKERIGESIASLRAEQLAKIDKTESEAWRSYELSKNPSLEIIRENGDNPKTTRKRKFNPAGNPEWLKVISKQVELRMKLLGLDKPESTGGNATPLLEVIVSTRAEAAKMLPYLDFAGEVEGTAIRSIKDGAGDDLDN
jgi:hypothetical protein